MNIKNEWELCLEQHTHAWGPEATQQQLPFVTVRFLEWAVCSAWEVLKRDEVTTVINKQRGEKDA